MAGKFTTDKVWLVPKGRMTAIYAADENGEKDFLSSTFSAEKADWIVEALKAHHGVKVIKEKPTATAVKSSAPKSSPAASKKAAAKKTTTRKK